VSELGAGGFEAPASLVTVAKAAIMKADGRIALSIIPRERVFEVVDDVVAPAKRTISSS
jgi:hypothetical protein